MTQITNLKALAARHERLAVASSIAPINERIAHFEAAKRYKEAAEMEVDYRPEVSCEGSEFRLLAEVGHACWYFARWLTYAVSLIGGLAVVGYAVWELVR